MVEIKEPRQSTVFKKTSLAIYLGIYIGMSIITTKWLFSLPLFGDLDLFLNALTKMFAGVSPYQNFIHLGKSFLYPPQSLLLLEPFNLIRNTLLRGILFSLVNLLLVFLTVELIKNRFKLSTVEIWYWYPLAFSFAPFTELLCIGQINTIPMFLFFMIYFWENKHAYLSGIFLSAAILIKVTPIVFLFYLASKNNHRAILGLIAGILIITSITISQFGLAPFIEFPRVLIQLNRVYDASQNSKSLISKISTLNNQNNDLEISREQLPESKLDFSPPIPSALAWIPPLLMAYAFVILLISSGIAHLTGEGEPLFIIASLFLTVVPSVVWYHHYVFWIPSIFICMAWARKNPVVVLWCMMGLILIQFDRWFLTYGLLIQIYAHFSILALIIYQITFFRSNASTGSFSSRSRLIAWFFSNSFESIKKNLFYRRNN